MITAYFGSAFDPPHKGHMDVIQQLLVDFDQVLVGPSAAHAFGKNMADFDIRIDMLRLSLADSGFCDVIVTDIEKVLLEASPGKPVYTISVLERLANEVVSPGDTLVFIMGPDNAKPEIWSQFYRHKEIEKQFGLFVAKERVIVRSSVIRERIINGDDTWIGMVTPGVVRSIQENNLYGLKTNASQCQFNPL